MYLPIGVFGKYKIIFDAEYFPNFVGFLFVFVYTFKMNVMSASQSDTHFTNTDKRRLA